ncbi:hypothetical protein Agub_g6203, partial [Astrephomene gubernaculifera]
ISPVRSPTLRTRRTMMVTPEPKPPGRVVAPARQQSMKSPGWRDGLLRLLQVMGDGLGERYAPLGQFWILGSLPTDKDRPGCGASGATASSSSAAGSGSNGSGTSSRHPSTGSGSGSCSAPGQLSGGAGPLQPAEGPRAVQSSASWLSPGNHAALFTRWESEIEEMQKDLMDAFAWTSFQQTIEVRGGAVPRKELLRTSAALNLAAT